MNNDLDELTQMSSHQFSILDISENLTLLFEDLSLIYNSNDNNRSINIYSRDLIKIPGLPYYFDPISDRYVLTLKPIETFDFFKNSKCFTFFDETLIPFSKNQVDLEKINFRIDFPKTSFPFDKSIGISVAIHSHNVIANRDRFYKLEQGKEYDILYSKIEDIRLHNYDNCIDRDDIEYDDDTRNYCLDKCYIDYFNVNNPDCYREFIFNQAHSLRRNQLPRSNTRFTHLCNNSKISKELSRSCKNYCKEDCYQAHYFVDISEKLQLYDEKYICSLNQLIFLNLLTNSRPNIIIQHFVETTFISLICNFGGIVGMYLGISLYSVSCDLWKITKKLFSKLILIKIENNNNQQNIVNLYLSILITEIELNNYVFFV